MSVQLRDQVINIWHRELITARSMSRLLSGSVTVCVFLLIMLVT